MSRIFEFHFPSPVHVSNPQALNIRHLNKIHRNISYLDTFEIHKMCQNHEKARFGIIHLDMRQRIAVIHEKYSQMLDVEFMKAVKFQLDEFEIDTI